MNVKYQSRRALIYLGASVLIGALGLVYATPVPADTKPVTMTITAVGKKQAPPPITKDDVNLFQNKERAQVANLRRGNELFLAILIDDSLQQTVATDWNALRSFIKSQAPDTYVAVAYNPCIELASILPAIFVLLCNRNQKAPAIRIKEQVLAFR